MTFEDRLWRQLEGAAARESRGARSRRRPAARRLVPIAAALAACLAAGAGVVSLPSSTPRRAAAERVTLRDAHLSAGVTGFGSLWAFDAASSHVVRLDPRSRRVTARVPLRSELSDVALAVGAGAVWAVPIEPIRHNAAAPAPARAVVCLRIDPRTGRVAWRTVLARAAGGSAAAPAGIVARPGAVWVWGERGAWRIDPGRDRVIAAISAPGDRVTGFAATDDRVTMATEAGRLISFDGRGARIGSVAISAPLERGRIAAVGGGVVTSRPGGLLASIDPVTGRDLWVVHLGAQPRDLQTIGGRLWALVADPDARGDALLELDPGDGHVVARLAPGVDDARTIAAGELAPVVTTQSGGLVVMRP